MSRVVEALVWSMLLIGVWIVTLSSVSTPELAVAAGCAVLSGVAVVGARAVTGARWAPSPRWIRWLTVLPFAIVADTGRMFGMAVGQLARGRRRDPGDIRDVPFGDRGDRPRAEARRALASLYIASTPSSIVVDAPPGDPDLVVHQLVDGPPSVEKAVSR